VCCRRWEELSETGLPCPLCTLPAARAGRYVTGWAPSAGLAERQRQQTRAQQHQTGRRQREESFGHKIMFTHDTPATLDARPNFLKLSESAFLQRGAAIFRERIVSRKSRLRGGQALERNPSNA
jgi:hypothetical protein